MAPKNAVNKTKNGRDNPKEKEVPIKYSANYVPKKRARGPSGRSKPSIDFVRNLSVNQSTASEETFEPTRVTVPITSPVRQSKVLLKSQSVTVEAKEFLAGISPKKEVEPLTTIDDIQNISHQSAADPTKTQPSPIEDKEKDVDPESLSFKDKLKSVGSSFNSSKRPSNFHLQGSGLKKPEGKETNSPQTDLNPTSPNNNNTTSSEIDKRGNSSLKKIGKSKSVIVSSDHQLLSSPANSNEARKNLRKQTTLQSITETEETAKGNKKSKSELKEEEKQRKIAQKEEEKKKKQQLKEEERLRKLALKEEEKKKKQLKEEERLRKKLEKSGKSKTVDISTSTKTPTQGLEDAVIGGGGMVAKITTPKKEVEQGALPAVDNDKTQHLPSGSKEKIPASECLEKATTAAVVVDSLKNPLKEDSKEQTPTTPNQREALTTKNEMEPSTVDGAKSDIYVDPVVSDCKETTTANVVEEISSKAAAAVDQKIKVDGTENLPTETVQSTPPCAENGEKLNEVDDNGKPAANEGNKQKTKDSKPDKKAKKIEEKKKKEDAKAEKKKKETKKNKT